MEHNSVATPHIEETTTGLSHRKMLIWTFLGSECLFFASLIGTYLVYQGKSLVGPYPEDIFSIPITSVSTFVLLMSSLSMVLAYAAISKGNINRFRVWILCTALLGITFLGFQVFEFREFAIHERHIECTPTSQVEACLEGAAEYTEPYGLTPRTNLFGTTFFTLTGFHGAHVAIGVLWLLSLLGFTFQRRLKRLDELDVDTAALYWHFVDVVWIVIFTVVYLIGVASA